MKVQVNREALLPALSRVGGVIERRQTLPILGNLLFEATGTEIGVTATDLEVEVSSRFDASVEEGGGITLPARKFTDICRALPEDAEIQIRIEGQRATVTAGRSRFTLSTLPASDYPIMDTGPEAKTLEFEARMLRNLLEKTSFAMAHQDVRYYLNGLFLNFSGGRLVAVATDGHRLAKVEDDLETDFEEGSGVILPRKTVLELNRLLQSHHEKVRVDLSERMIRAFIGETVITSKLVDGRYPDYQRVIPLLADKVAVVAKDKLRQSLMRTSILSNDKYRGVRLTFDQNEIRLQAHNPEQEEAEDEVEAEYEDEEVSIGFNVGYLLDILGILDGEEVEIRFSDSDSSALIRNSGVENQAFVVMPMRL